MLNSNEKRECSNYSIDLCATFQLAAGVSFRTRQISLAYIYPHPWYDFKGKDNVKNYHICEGHQDILKMRLYGFNPS